VTFTVGRKKRVPQYENWVVNRLPDGAVYYTFKEKKKRKKPRLTFRHCFNCGVPLPRKNGKVRKFCSSKCYWAYVRRSP
jgi:hypothetical protein